MTFNKYCFGAFSFKLKFCFFFLVDDWARKEIHSPYGAKVKENIQKCGSGGCILSIPDRHVGMNYFFFWHAQGEKKLRKEGKCWQRWRQHVWPPPPSPISTLHFHTYVLIVCCRLWLAGCNVTCIAITDQLPMTAAPLFFYLASFCPAQQNSYNLLTSLPNTCLFISRGFLMPGQVSILF